MWRHLNSLLFDRDPESTSALRFPRSCSIVAAYLPAGLTFPIFLQPVSLTDIWFLSDTVHSALDCGVTSPSHLRIFTLPFASVVSFPFDPPARRITTAEGFLARITACNVSVYPTNGSASLLASKSGRSNATTVSGRFGCCAAVDLLRAGRS